MCCLLWYPVFRPSCLNRGVWDGVLIEVTLDYGGVEYVYADGGGVGRGWGRSELGVLVFSMCGI